MRRPLDTKARRAGDRSNQMQSAADQIISNRAETTAGTLGPPSICKCQLPAAILSNAGTGWPPARLVLSKHLRASQTAGGMTQPRVSSCLRLALILETSQAGRTWTATRQAISRWLEICSKLVKSIACTCEFNVKGAIVLLNPGRALQPVRLVTGERSSCRCLETCRVEGVPTQQTAARRAGARWLPAWLLHCHAGFDARSCQADCYWCGRPNLPVNHDRHSPQFVAFP